ncbi:MAG: D-aminoacylase [Opitutaceae bacterium]|nr:D-aminoacylase [Verrucomicrobiales bacterium]
MISLRFIVGLCLALAAVTGVVGAPFDLAIRHGLVVDGTGKPGFRADVGITAGRIVAVGSDIGPASREIDATGLVVAPGFIDVHTHAEGILHAPSAENFIRMGVTTVIAGNCGTSMDGAAEFLSNLTRARPSINVATLIGHNTIRAAVMGTSFMRPPSADELGRMKVLVAQAMKEGALGLSTGLIYIPGKYAKVEELVELARVVATNGGIYTSHVRDENEGLIESMNEVFRIGREAQVPVQISHLKLAGNIIQPQTIANVTNLQAMRLAGLGQQVATALRAARQSGLKVTEDHYVYSAVTMPAEGLLPDRYAGLSRDALLMAIENPTDRATLLEEVKRSMRDAGLKDLSHAFIMVGRRFKPIEGLDLVSATQRRKGNPSLDAQLELVLDLVRGGGVILTVYDQNEADLLPILRDPGTMFASDGGVFAGMNDLRHPRAFGNNARVLAHCVREKNWLTLEEAIRRMTSLPATTFNLRDRGELRPGARADVVIFDAARVQDQSTYLEPQRPATGFRLVLVNGVDVVVDDRHTGAKPGQAVRRGE